jgi:hypothetical protein
LNLRPSGYPQVFIKWAREKKSAIPPQLEGLPGKARKQHPPVTEELTGDPKELPSRKRTRLATYEMKAAWETYQEEKRDPQMSDFLRSKKAESIIKKFGKEDLSANGVRKWLTPKQ